MNRSKPIVLSIVLLIIIAANASAQTTIHWGGRVGANVFKLTGGSFDEKFKFGYSVGGYAEIGFKGSRWGFQPELLLNETVARTTAQFNNLFQGASFQDVTMNFVTIPILVTYRVNDALTALFGPQYGYMFFQTQGLVQHPPYPTDIFNKNDFSILFGGQMNLLKRVKFGARYVIGFTQFNNLDDNEESWKNQGFQFYLSYRIK